MKLRFYAAGTALVRERNADGSHFSIGVGQFFRYVGRAQGPEHIPSATEEPYECDAGAGEADYLAREVRAGDLYAADKATAEAIGVEFVDVTFSNGSWAPAPAASKKKSSSTEGNS